MSLSKLEKLMYTIGVVDKATGPVNKIMAKMQQLSEKATASQDQMMRGFMTTVAGGMALSRSLAPAIDHVAALGEVQSLGVLEADLNQLTKTSFEFSAQWGGNSAEFVRSAYDIQSAISGLTGDELSSFTKASNILAVATKADAGTITSYMGTMYGIFEQTANKMGKSDWVNKIAGQTAKAVQMYKTTGAEMQSAFSALGSKATNRGANSAEQMAVLGELQLVLKSGSVAGTQYASFIDGIGKAEKSLNISLTDKNGDMLGMDEMLSRINGRLVGIGSIAKGDILNKAFGSKTAASVVDILSTKVNKLRSGTDELNNVSDASKAIEMANIIASPWDRLSGTFNAAATAMGQRLLPVVEPFVEILAAAFAGVVNLTDQFPFLSSVIATLVVGVVGLITLFGIMNMTMGLYRLALISVGAVTNAMTIITKLWQASLFALRVVGFLGLIATTGAYLAMMGIYKGAILAAQGATWLFNAALTANPIGLVIAGVVGLIAGIAALIFYWDDIVAAFKDTSWGQALGAVFDWISEKFSQFIDGVTWVLEALGLMDGKEVELKTSVKQPGNIEALNADIITGMPGNVYTPNANQIGAVNMAAFNDIAQQQTLVKQPANIYTPTSSQMNAASLATFNDMSAQQSSVLNIASTSEKVEQYKQSNKALATTNTQRVSKTNYFAQNNNSSNSNSSASTDNSKRVYIDNLTMKSDNIADDFEQLMELAG